MRWPRRLPLAVLSRVSPSRRSSRSPRWPSPRAQTPERRARSVQRLALPPDELHPGRDPTPSDFLKIMGTRVGRSTLFGIPLQQQWSHANSGDVRADLLPAERRARSTTTPSPTPTSPWRIAPVPRRAGAIRSDDHRVQPGRHVRGGSHPPGAEDVSRRLHRHRRVQHPQGIRLVEDRRRGREPHEPGARPRPRVRRRESASSSSCTATSTCRLRRQTPSRSTCRR